MTPFRKLDGPRLSLLMDIDSTLTPPRRPLEKEMAEALKTLAVPFHVAAGSDLSLLRAQFFEPLHDFGFRGVFEAFLSNGSAQYRCRYEQRLLMEEVATFSLREHLGDAVYSWMRQALERVIAEEAFRLPPPLKVIGSLIIDRGPMVNLCPIGRPEGHLTTAARQNREEFARFDGKCAYRRRMFARLNEVLTPLIREKNLLIRFGGETSFDLMIQGKDKTNAVRTLLSDGIEELVFIGDALFEDGNDSVILEFIRDWSEPQGCPVSAVSVQGYRDTIRILHERGWIIESQ